MFKPIRTKRYKLFNADCLDVLPKLKAGTVDLVLTDPPYGTTACKWDTIIPLDQMWSILLPLVKNYKPIVLTSIQPYTTSLIYSNIRMFKYCWIWKKQRPSNFFQAKYAPLNQFEDICVFSYGGCNNGSKNPMSYNPQGLRVINSKRRNSNTGGGVGVNKGCSSLEGKNYIAKHEGYPKTLLDYPTEKRGGHPTQKPVALMEYLIKTYTNENDIVLDFTMGSGTTGVACANLNRRFIGIELEPKYFEIAADRIKESYSKEAYSKEAHQQKKLFT